MKKIDRPTAKKALYSVVAAGNVSRLINTNDLHHWSSFGWYFDQVWWLVFALAWAYLAFSVKER